MKSQTLQPSVRLLVLLVVLSLVFLFVSRPAEAEAPIVTTEYVVDAGDTVWDIARASAPQGTDPREAVVVIQELNGLDGGIIHPGQVLLIPTG